MSMCNCRAALYLYNALADCFFSSDNQCSNTLLGEGCQVSIVTTTNNDVLLYSHFHLSDELSSSLV